MILGARGVGCLWWAVDPGSAGDACSLDRGDGTVLGEVMFEEGGDVVGGEVCEVVGEFLVFSLHAHVHRVLRIDLSQKFHPDYFWPVITQCVRLSL